MKRSLGIVAVLIGILLVLDNLRIIDFADFIFPAIVVVLGLLILLNPSLIGRFGNFFKIMGAVKKRRGIAPAQEIAKEGSAPVSATSQDAAAPIMNSNIAVALLVGGAVLVLFGLVDFNSAGSQLKRAIGVSDPLPVALMVFGAIMAVAGLVGILSAQSTSNSQSTGARSTLPNQMVPPATSELSGKTAIEQLERLGALKEKGLLTQEEFDAQKKKIIG